MLQQFTELNEKYGAIQRTTSELQRSLNGTNGRSPDHVTFEPTVTTRTTTWPMEEHSKPISPISTSPSTGVATEQFHATGRDTDFTTRRLSTIRRRIDGIGYKRSKMAVTAAGPKTVSQTFNGSSLKRQNATEDTAFVGDKRKADTRFVY